MAIPNYVTSPTADLIAQYDKLNTPESIRARQRKVRKHGRTVDDLVEKLVDHEDPERLDPNARMKKAEALVKGLAKEWYTKLGIKDANVDDENVIDAYLAQAGIQSSYGKLVQDIANDEADLDASNQNNELIGRLKNAVMLQYDTDGLKANKIAQALATEHGHYHGWKDHVSGKTGKAFNDSINGNQLVREYQIHAQQQVQQQRPKQTYDKAA